MASRERTAPFQNYTLKRRANADAPFKPPRPTMPLSRVAARKDIGEGKSSRAKIDSDNEDGITAHPESSDDEEEDDSANIKPTVFASKEAQKGGDNELQTSRRRGKRSTVEPPIVITDSPRSINRARTKDPIRVGAGMSKSLDFTNPSRGFGWSASSQRRKRPIYGVNAKGGSSSSLKGAKKSVPVSPEPDIEDDELVRPEIQSSPIEEFKIIKHDDLDTPQKYDEFHAIDIGDMESPTLTPYLKKTKSKDKLKRQKEESDDEDLSGFKIPEGFDSSFEHDLLDSPVRVEPQPSADTNAKRRKLDNEVRLDEVPEYVKNMVKEDGCDNLLDQINIPRHSDFSSDLPRHLSELDNNLRSGYQPVCPVCMEPVDSKDLESWGEMKGFNQQSKFCRYHQKMTAKADWSEKGYPKIDWHGMDERICEHHKFIKKLVKGAPCHYRTVLDDAIKSGKNRTLKDMSTSLVPGYYGSRGLKVISDNIMSRFARLLKEQAVKDRLIAARGVPSFVQAVLVLEVGCAFIMEDMNLSAEEARDVLAESIAIGELVNEEVKDVMRRRHESDDD